MTVSDAGCRLGDGDVVSTGTAWFDDVMRVGRTAATSIGEPDVMAASSLTPGDRDVISAADLRISAANLL